MPGSPASPDHPLGRQIAYILIGIYIGLTAGLQNGLLLANLTTLQGNLGLTPVESGWITVAYSMTNACASILLFKARQQFGIQRFVRVCMVALLTANFAQLFDAGYTLELIARGMSGLAASGLVTLASFYIMQGLPAKARLAGLLLGVGLAQVAIPMARALSPLLLESGDIARLFELQFGMSLITVGLVYLLRLPPGETVKAFEKLDLVTFPLLAGGIGLLCAFLVQGRVQWWTTPWLGEAFATSILLIGAAFIIEQNRANPMLQTRWMGSREVVLLAITAASIRVLLSEQNFGASGLLTTLGMSNDQLVTYYWMLSGAALAGLLVSIIRLDPQDLRRPVMAALAVIALAAFFDIGVGTMTRPADLYWSQAAIAFAAVYFMGGILMEGLLRALSRGPEYIVSFIAVFGLSQTLGGLAGASAFAAFHTIRVKTHLMTIGSDLALSNPLVAQAVQRSAANYNMAIQDPALRQATGASQLVQRAGRDAAVLAFNDFFLLVGILASLTFLLLFARWSYYRRRGINPLEKELAALQSAMAGSRE